MLARVQSCCTCEGYHVICETQTARLALLALVIVKTHSSVLAVFEIVEVLLAPLLSTPCPSLPLVGLVLTGFICSIQILLAAHCRKFAYQVLVCLRFLRAQKLLHCDLKPENILLKENGRSGIKVRPLTQVRALTP